MTTLQQALNRQGHGMDRAILASTLCRLARRRWIAFSPPPYGDHPPGMISLDRRGVERELTTGGRFDQGPYYSLTPLGGQVWESFAQPEWERYIEHSLTEYIDDCSDDDHDEWCRQEVTTADRCTLDRYMEAVRTENLVAPGSESLEMRHDWTYCYWKPPRSAYVWRFVAKRTDGLRPPSTQWFQERWCEWR